MAAGKVSLTFPRRIGPERLMRSGNRSGGPAGYFPADRERTNESQPVCPAGQAGFSCAGKAVGKAKIEKGADRFGSFFDVIVFCLETQIGRMPDFSSAGGV